MSTDLILVGDCGGTNSRLRLYSVAPNARVENNLPPGDLVKWSEYQNAEYEGKGGFPAIVRAFMSSAPAVTETPTAACLAVAGPVESNRVVFTNRNWVIDGADLEKTLGIQRVRLVNDFVANGYGLLTRDHEKECVCLQRAPHVAGAPIACIGAGTGLGECFSTATEVGKEYDTYASEGGHAEVAPRNVRWNEPASVLFSRSASAIAPTVRMSLATSIARTTSHTRSVRPRPSPGRSAAFSTTRLVALSPVCSRPCLSISSTHWLSSERGHTTSVDAQRRGDLAVPRQRQCDAHVYGGGLK